MINIKKKMVKKSQNYQEGIEFRRIKIHFRTKRDVLHPRTNTVDSLRFIVKFGRGFFLKI